MGKEERNGYMPAQGAYLYMKTAGPETPTEGAQPPAYTPSYSYGG